MVSRRLLRIKVLHIIYAFSKNNDGSLTKSEKELFYSIEKAYELYHYFFLLLIEIKQYAEERIEFGKSKRFPSSADLNPNTRFVDNPVIAQLIENEQLKDYLKVRKLSWVNEPGLIKKLYQEFVETEQYQSYIHAGQFKYRDELEIVISLVIDVFANSEDLFTNLEEKSVYWNDDVEFMLSMVIKTIERFKKEKPGGGKLLPLYKEDEDRVFARDLFRKALIHRNETEALIHQFTTNWEVERIAYMDILIITLALTEVKEFPNIPVKVTMNEYIELAKYYSTEKSSIFINGVLDKIIGYQRKEGHIKKTGRGLVGEP